MKFALAFVLSGFPFGGPAREAPADPWFGADKLKHFVVSAAIQSAGHSVLRANGFAYREAAWTAGVMTLSVGVGKELWDRRRRGAFSWRDLSADALGGGAGAIVIRQTDR